MSTQQGVVVQKEEKKGFFRKIGDKAHGLKDKITRTDHANDASQVVAVHTTVVEHPPGYVPEEKPGLFRRMKDKIRKKDGEVVEATPWVTTAEVVAAPCTDAVVEAHPAEPVEVRSGNPEATAATVVIPAPVQTGYEYSPTGDAAARPPPPIGVPADNEWDADAAVPPAPLPGPPPANTEVQMSRSMQDSASAAPLAGPPAAARWGDLSGTPPAGGAQDHTVSDAGGSIYGALAGGSIYGAPPTGDFAVGGDHIGDMALPTTSEVADEVAAAAVDRGVTDGLEVHTGQGNASAAVDAPAADSLSTDPAPAPVDGPAAQ